MKNVLNSKLVLQNALKYGEGNYIEFQGDIGGYPTTLDLVAISVSVKNEYVSVNNEESDSELFHLDKHQIRCLIDYLNILYNDMNDLKSEL